MRKWTICGYEGLCDDWGYSEPYTAAAEIKRRIAQGKEMTEEEVEKIANLHHCYVKW